MACALCEFTTHRMSRLQTKAAAKCDELLAHLAHGRAVGATEVGDGFEVRRQAAGEPDQL